METDSGVGVHMSLRGGKRDVVLCSIMDLLQGIWITGEVVGELELESVGDLGP